MKLYDNKHAPNPRRVRMFMAEKGVACDSQQVDIVQGENLGEAYLAINPRGLLPALVLDDGTVLDETVAICRYLEETHPQPPLLGVGPLGKAQVEARQRHMEFDGLLGAAEAFRNAYPRFAQRGLGGVAETVPAIPALVERGKGMVLRFYRRLDAYLAESRFVAGDAFTIADITALCTVDFAVAGARVPLPEGCENLRRWHGQVSARPSASA